MPGGPHSLTVIMENLHLMTKLKKTKQTKKTNKKETIISENLTECHATKYPLIIFSSD